MEAQRYGHIAVLPLQRRLLVDGRPATPGARAFDLLLALIERSGRLATKEELLDAVWPGLVVEENNLTVQIGALRKLIGAEAIVTIPGRGYRFVLPAVAMPPAVLAHSPGGEAAAGGSEPAPEAGFLPRPMTSLIGRDRETAEVAALLGSSRLVTLLGTGGVGKTRLMLEVASVVAENFRDGVWFVDLTPITDPEQVVAAVARSLNVAEEPGHTLIQTLCAAAGARRLLLLLDNCEHVLSGCAAFAAAFLRSGSQPKILATSREPLNLGGEQAFPLSALSLPVRSADAAAIADAAAVRLFVDRARRHAPDFSPRPGQWPVVAGICNRLEGIPLSLELAAARVRVLSLEQLLAQLNEGFALLSSGPRDAPARHRTLRDTIAWSYDLLNGSERSLLCRLAVFSGGWTVDAAQHVCRREGFDETSVLEGLTQLIQKSLVVAWEQDGSMRHRLLDSVRFFARERLHAEDDEAQALRRHLDYHVELAEAAEAGLSTPDQPLWLHRLQAEHDNLRAALSVALATAEDIDKGLRLAAALRRFWTARGFLSEGRDMLARLLAAPPIEPVTAARGKALSVAGALAFEQSEYAAARALYEQSMVIRKGLGDRQGVANLLNNLANVHLGLGDPGSARPLHEESLAIRRELQDRAGVGVSLLNLGMTSLELEEFDAAEAYYRESLTIHRELGDELVVASVLNQLSTLAEDRCDHAAAFALAEEALAIRRSVGDRPGISGSLNNLGSAALRLGNVSAALDFQRQSLAIAMEVGKGVAIAEALEALADVSLSVSDGPLGARLGGAAERLRETIGVPLSPRQRIGRERHIIGVRGLMEDARAFAAAWDAGRTMSLEEAVALALGRGSASDLADWQQESR